ncbi:hypothetical protein ACFQ07_05930, partial [Actinomadura adrarensis]
GHIELTFADTRLLGAARDLIGGGTADPEALTLQVPGDGSVSAVRDLLNRLEERSIDVAEMSVHTPDLDDVFLTLTGQNKTHDNAQSNGQSNGRLQGTNR